VSTEKTLPEHSPDAERRNEASQPQGYRGGLAMVLGILALSTAMAFVLLAKYSATLGYVKRTLDEPAEPNGWELRAYAPEECIDAAMTWTAECRGIKSMCDMYVERVVDECMGSRDRLAYCEHLGDTTGTTEFGVPECRARGVQRHINQEACANAYRSIDNFCKRTRAEAPASAESAESR